MVEVKNKDFYESLFAGFNIIKVFCHFLSTDVASGMIRTLGLRITSQEFYHCAATGAQLIL